ncbi:MAG: DUF2281 domain-containing protein [Scytolyngbya sp. HA4215-MV1]|jgi:hypothetical protein|nr:DUF2281 domain-containing protein [Scytolyngbya sp. HA4215-MV1]
MLTNTQHQTIIEKILKLPPDKVTQVEDFIDFLLTRNHAKSQPEEPLLSVAGILSGDPLTAEAIEAELYGD